MMKLLFFGWRTRIMTNPARQVGLESDAFRKNRTLNRIFGVFFYEWTDDSNDQQMNTHRLLHHPSSLDPLHERLPDTLLCSTNSWSSSRSSCRSAQCAVVEHDDPLKAVIPLCLQHMPRHPAAFLKGSVLQGRCSFAVSSHEEAGALRSVVCRPWSPGAVEIPLEGTVYHHHRQLLASFPF
jgi:hypothetical protein